MGEGPLVRVYYARASSWTDSSIVEARTLLDAKEEERAGRFHFDVDRRMYIGAHALLRKSLSRHAAVSPWAWRFVVGSHGRPEIDGFASRLRFSLSHTRGLVACAVTNELDIGLDVEDTMRAAPLEIADRWFAPAEVAALSALPVGERAKRFYVYWTLKEAYVKARGFGLSLPLHEFAFAVGDLEIGVTFGEGCPDDSEGWRFESWCIDETHRAAVALRTAGTMRVEVEEAS